jgi:hypothetical protein
MSRCLSVNFLYIAASPWEARRMKAELAEAKSPKATVEERIKKLHSVRTELELKFDNDKRSLLKQQERDRETLSLNSKWTFVFTFRI